MSEAERKFMIQNFSLLELVIYAIVWAVIGGLPGFYLFLAIDRNPRLGARIGVIVGVAIGLIGALSGIIGTPAALVNTTLILWLMAMLIIFAVNFSGKGKGQHTSQATMRQRVADLAYGLLLPTFIIVFIIVVFPMIWNLLLAFRPIRLRDLPDISLFSLSDLTLDNFSRVLGQRDFVNTLVRTLVYTVSGTVLAIGLGLIAALVVKDTFPGRNIVRGLMLFPYIAPIVSVVLIWKLLFNAQFGIINELVAALGGRRIDPLNTPGLAFFMIILFQGWRYFPFAFLFILARIQAIPDELYEAAKVDGALPSQRLRYVTLPQLQAVFGTLFLLRFIWTFNKFDDVFLLTGGAANTKLITIEVYDQLFSSRNVGASSAVAVLLAVLLFFVVAIYFRWFMVEEN
jgi:multiple sugar transport system permease protein